MKKAIYLSFALMFAFAISKAQSIPNAGFESWTSMTGYNNPDSWSCLNDMTSSMSAYTCTKGTPGSPGVAYLKLTSKTVSGLGVVNGIAVCGTMNTSTMQPVSGFAFNQRPANFNGKWQHMIYGTSQGYIDVQLTRWDVISQSRVIVASKHQTLSGMAMSWANFTMPLTYMDGNYPDSCIITMAASGSAPTNNDYLWVDNLGFTGTVTGIAQTTFDANISLYPNPATDNLFLNLSPLKDKYVTIEIADIQGKIVMSNPNSEVASNISVTVSELPKGNYVLNIITKEGTIKRNFIKQ
jgi:hypothetical protein